MKRPVWFDIHSASDMLYRLKVDEEALAYPLALGMRKALAAARRLDFDAIVPVPLSPDELKAKELHRTLALANELSPLLEASVIEGLSLSALFSKRRIKWLGQSQKRSQRL